MGMRTRTISIRDLSSSDEEAWRDLARRSVEPNPFYEVDFLVPACHHLRNGKSVVLLVAEDDGQFHACLPVRPANLPRILSPPVIASWQHLYGFLGTPLVAPERGVEALASLLMVLRGSRARTRVVVLELFGDDGPISSYLRSAAGELGLMVRTHTSGERAVLCCRDDKAEPLPRTVKRERRAKARQWRRLCDDWGDPAVVDLAAEGDSSTAFVALEASGWKGKAGTALGSRAGDAAFYHEVTARFGAVGRLHLYSLQVGGKTIAMQTNLCAGRGLFDWKVAYDELFARYGPGGQLQLRVIDLACEDGVCWIDSCADVGDEHQFRLSPDRRRIATLVIRGDGRSEGPMLALALLLVKVSGKLRGVSIRTLRDDIMQSFHFIGRVFPR